MEVRDFGVGLQMAIKLNQVTSTISCTSAFYSWHSLPLGLLTIVGSLNRSSPSHPFDTNNPISPVTGLLARMLRATADPYRRATRRRLTSSVTRTQAEPRVTLLHDVSSTAPHCTTPRCTEPTCRQACVQVRREQVYVTGLERTGIRHGSSENRCTSRA